jgi:glutaconate CoA-transferase subunit B
VDFVTSPGYLGGSEERERQRLPGAGPEVVITDLGVLRFASDTHEMVLETLHPGATLERAQQETGWKLRLASPLKQTEPPTAEELRVLREELTLPGGAA